MNAQPLGWIGIVRLGLVQTALGAIVVLTTSTINRVMVVEMALPAALPGALVAWHYALQILRPRWGFGSDDGGRRTPWIIAGMGILALGGVGAAVATALMAQSTALGTTVAVLAFSLVGIGVGAAGTNLLALLATRVEPGLRAPAATIVWLMMIAGFVVTTILAGKYLDPFSPMRLVGVSGTVSVVAFLLSIVALYRVEGGAAAVSRDAVTAPAQKPKFSEAIAQIWDEPKARNFTVFVFVSMLAYSMQDLILEPFAGVVFSMTPGQSTQLAGVQHGGVFAGMVLVALACNARVRIGTLRGWTIGGCIASALALLGLVGAGLVGPGWPLKQSVFLLGVANGAFAVAAIGSMMELAGSGRKSREGTRMGLWGAAQAIAFGLGGFTGAASADLLRASGLIDASAYVAVFAAEGVLFLLAAYLAVRHASPAATDDRILPVEREPRLAAEAH